MMNKASIEYPQEEYNEFLRYVKSTWRGLFETDFHNKVEIKKIIVSSHKNNFDVFVYIEDNVYDDLDDDWNLIEVPYSGKAIKTGYSLQSDVILYMLLDCDIVGDLGLSNVEFIMFDYVDGLEIDEDLTKRLRKEEEDYAETLYCIMHDL